MTRRDGLPADSAGPLDIEEAAAFVREITFGSTGVRGFRIGVEAELLPFDRRTHRMASVNHVLVPAIDGLAESDGWSRSAGAKGAPAYALPSGARLTFEPGGQIEYATPPLHSPSAALRDLRGVLARLSECTGAEGVDLYGLGIDPFNGPREAPLQITADRYRDMDAYYARFGPAGARMMRQTAAIQVNLDPSVDRLLAWQVLNGLAPVVVAMFANSRRYGGRDSGYANYRSRTWQTLDRTRTGLPWSPDEPVDHYARFALDAPAMFIRSDRDEYHPFRHWVARGMATRSTVRNHLSTLFPEVRPRHYFEVRSIDALPVSMYAAPIMLLSGLTVDDGAAKAAAAILGSPDTAWLRRAAQRGLADATLAQRARDVTALALAICRQRPDLCDREDVDAAERFFKEFTWKGRSPADAADALKNAATAA